MKHREAKTKYEVLPQFSESDSDIDIFNAKEQISNDVETKKPRKLSSKTRPCIAFLIILASLASIVIVFLLQTAYPDAVIRDNYVKTECGLISGDIERINTTNDGVRSIYVYRSIPYAVPPVKSLRWNPPIPFTGDHCWKDVYSSSRSQLECFHGVGKGSEDCLYLSIRTPSNSYNSKLPVFVWLNSNRFIPNSEFIATMDMVVVTVSYRLNVFGYLSLKELWTDDSMLGIDQTAHDYHAYATHGNYGLLDQIEALRWIQRNIQSFGGDPDAVTICGDGFDGSSVLALLASPLTFRLFNKAIAMNPSTKIGIPYEQASEYNRFLVNSTECHLSVDVANCLRNLSADDLISVAQNMKSVSDKFDFPVVANTVVSNEKISEFVTSDSVLPEFSATDLFSNKTGVSLLIGNTMSEMHSDPKQLFNGTRAAEELKEFLIKRLNTFRLQDDSQYLLNELIKHENLTNNNAQKVFLTIVSNIHYTCPLQSFTKTVLENIIATNKVNVLALSSIKSMNNLFSNALLSFQRDVSTGHNNLSPVEQNYTSNLRKTVKDFIVKDILPWQPNNIGVLDQTGSMAIKSSIYEDQCSVLERNGFSKYAWID